MQAALHPQSQHALMSACGTPSSKASMMMMNMTPPRSASRLQQQRDDLVVKPFFLMDWLEELVSPDQDVHQLAELLQTPGKLKEIQSTGSTASVTSSPLPSQTNSPPGTPKSSNRKKAKQQRESNWAFTMKPQQLFKDSTACNTNASPEKNNNKKRPCGGGGQKHSLLALGNGWNAKGLKKAQQGLWKDALACWDVALELRLPLLPPMSEEVANTWNNRGIALGKLGDYPQALESLNKALEIRLFNETKGDSNSKQKSVVISTYHNIANVHQQAGDYNKALEVFGHAKSLCHEQQQRQQESGDAKSSYSAMLSMARLCTAMGHVYYQAEQWIDARDAYNDAVWVYQQLQEQNLNHPHQDEMKELQKDIQELDQKVQQQPPF